MIETANRADFRERWRLRSFLLSSRERQGTYRMKWWMLGVVGLLVTACATLEGRPQHLIGAWGGPHAGIEFEAGLADVLFDCASGTLDVTRFRLKRSVQQCGCEHPPITAQ